MADPQVGRTGEEGVEGAGATRFEQDRGCSG